MRLAIDHTTSYRFNETVPWGLQRVRLRPLSRHGLVVEDWSLDIGGANLELSFQDQHQNHVDLISFAAETEVEIRAHGHVVTERSDGIVTDELDIFPLWMLSRPTDLTRPDSAITDLASRFEIPKAPEPGLLHAISQAIVERVPWQEGATGPTTTAAQSLVAGAGVCQDHAHIFLAVVRELGFAARYVSGYLMMDDRIDQAAMHAWAEVWIDGLGFVGFDVSNRISPDERYVRIAVGRDYREAAPIAGTRYGASEEFLNVALSVALQQQ